LQESRQRQAQIAVQSLIQQQVQKQEQIEKLNNDFLKKSKTQKEQQKKRPRDLLFRQDRKSKIKDLFGRVDKLKQSYDVLIKKKGKGFITANKRGLSREAALGLGASITDQYANRSFIIKKSKRRFENRPDLEAKANLLFKFRRRIGKSKLPLDSYVEKSAYAIDSPNELRQITYEGIKASRRRATRQKSINLLRLGRVQAQNRFKEISYFKGARRKAVL
jgi:hypothetical protein